MSVGGGLGMQPSTVGAGGGAAQSLLSQSSLQSSLQSHLSLGGSGGSSSPQSTLGGGGGVGAQSSQTLFQHNKVNLGQSGGVSGGGFGGTSLANFGQNSLSSHLVGLGQNSLTQSGFGSLGQQNMGQQSLSQQSLGQQNIGQQVLGQQVMDTQGLNQQNLGKQGLGQQGLGQQTLTQPGLGGQGLGTQGLGQHGIQSSSNPNFMANFDQASSSMNQNHFPKDIEDEANSYFQQIIITKSIPINNALDMLKRFQSSSDKRETDVFSCMLHALFEEYKFFNQYPEQELYITGKLFGGIIERGLVTFVPLGYALRIILDSLQFPPSSKMFMFGINAIDEFKHKLKDYPQYCRFLKEKNPNYKDFPPRLLEYIEHGEESQEPPSAKFSAAQQQQSQQSGFPVGSGSSAIQSMQQQSPFPSMFSNQSNYTQNNQTMFGQNNSGTSSLFNSTPPSSSPANPSQMASSQMTSFNLQSILNNPAAAAVSKGTIGSSLGNIGSSLGNSNFSMPPSSSPSVLSHQTLGGAGQQVTLGGAGQQVTLGGSSQQVTLGGASQQVTLGGSSQQVTLGGSSQQVTLGAAGQQVTLGAAGQQMNLPVPQGRSTPTRTVTPQGGWGQTDLQQLQQPAEDKKVRGGFYFKGCLPLCNVHTLFFCWCCFHKSCCISCIFPSKDFGYDFEICLPNYDHISF